MTATSDPRSRAADPLAEPRRLDSLDAARAAAAMFVVLQHGLEKFVPWIPRDYSVLNLGQVGVVCFFLISGFVIPYSLQSHGSLLKYAISRVFRLFPLYWFVLAVTIILLCFKLPVLGQDAIAPPSWRSIIAHLFMIQGWLKVPNLVGISWTLVIEMVFYFVTAFVFLLRPGSLPRLVFIACLSLLGISMVGLHFHKSLPVYPAALILTAFAGQAVEYNWSGRISRFQAVLTVGSVLFTCLASIAMREAVNAYDINFATACVSWSAGYIMFLAVLGFRVRSGLLSYLGRISYSTYLLHPVIIALLAGSFAASWVLLVFAVATTVALATLTFYSIEQPGIAAGKSLFKKLARPLPGRPSLSGGGIAG
jgi:peptidoglycan/LPS O-acetylase OafA/YrhL